MQFTRTRAVIGLVFVGRNIRALIKINLFLFSLVGISMSMALAGEPVTKEEAYELVEDLIVEGKYGGYLNIPDYSDGKRKEILKFFPSPRNKMPFVSSKLNRDPRWTGYSISLTDSRGRSFFGLRGGGGWTLDGGLVDFVKLNFRTFELFGFKVLKWYNGFNGYFKYKEMKYDFYLVERITDRGKGEILKKWPFGYDEIIFKPLDKVVGSLGRMVEEGKITQREMEDVFNDPNNRFENIEGFLNVIPGNGKIEIIIKGLKEDFNEKVRIE